MAASRPWLRLYGSRLPHSLTLEHQSVLELFAAAVARAPERPLVVAPDETLTVAQVDAASDAVAAALGDAGVGRGDRVALQMQNGAEYLLGLLGAWKAGAIAVAVNPMWKGREVEFVLADSGARELLDADAVRELARAGRGHRVAPAGLGPDDVAVLTYTSGTTGPPKGAMNTHRNVVFNAQTYRSWVGLTEDDVVLGVAPFFHVTGLVAHLAVALLVPAPLVVLGRFDAGATLEAIERHRATFTVAAITVFHALMNEPDVERRDLGSFRKVFSGGAPIASATVEAWERLTGTYVHNVYGLTETTSPSHAVPFGARAPVDAATGALSVGVPVFDTVVRVLDDEGRELPPGEVGELATSGPGVVPGYWRNPEETARAFPHGELRTGDVGTMDEQGWFYLLDRKKDLIIASGYKVWPREVEDVLLAHPAVREAAVVGVPDSYRGESVKAVVSLRRGAEAAPDQLVAWCRERLAAYKYPRVVEVVEELPKTATGKILRRALRDEGAGAA